MTREHALISGFWWLSFASAALAPIACASEPLQTLLLSNRPVVLVDDRGTRFGISKPLHCGQPIELATPVRVSSPAPIAGCFSKLEIDQCFTRDFFGSKCTQTEESSGQAGTQPTCVGSAPPVLPDAALWYCSDEWVVRVVIAPCANDGAFAQSFRVVQIALRNTAQLK